MNHHHATADASNSQERVSSAAARLLDQEAASIAPISATLALCIVGSAQDLQVVAVRLTLITILVVIILAIRPFERPSSHSLLSV